MFQEKSKAAADIQTKGGKGEDPSPNQPDEVMYVNGCAIRLYYAPKTDEKALLDIEAILHKNFTL